MVVLEVLSFFAATVITTKAAVMASVVFKNANKGEEGLPESTAVTLEEIEQQANINCST